MYVVKQLSVFLENRPGTLADIADSLAKANVNIQGFTVSDTIDHAVVRMILNDPIRAIHVLGEAGLLVIETDILAFPLSNRPGALADLSHVLGNSGVNIDYAYGSTGGERNTETLYVKVSDLEKALAVLKE